jgi:hypothetical protein
MELRASSRFCVPLALVVLAGSAGACGGSGNSGTSASTPLKSEIGRRLIVRGTSEAGISKAKGTEIADCVIAKLAGEGITTLGQFDANRSESEAAVAKCTAQVLH